MKRSKHRCDSRSRSRSRSKDRSRHKHKKHKRDSRRRSIDKNVGSSVDDSSKIDYGPELPSLSIPNEATDNTIEVCGPALPPHMLNKRTEGNSNNTKNSTVVAVDRTHILGPSLPLAGVHYSINKGEKSDSSNDDDDEIYGPLPPQATSMSKAHLALEERALQMKIDMLNTDKEVKDSREQWMIELPNSQRSKIGLGPRQFRPTPGPDLSDRSSWTDTPSDKQNKNEQVSMDQLRKETALKETLKRDKTQEKMAKKSKTKRKDMSLLEIHQEKLKKEKKKSEKDGVRRPFSRDIDLQVNRFDEAQKKSILKKAQLLDDRFSKGQAKYL